MHTFCSFFISNLNFNTLNVIKKSFDYPVNLILKKKRNFLTTVSSIFFVKISITRFFHLSNEYYIHIFRLVAKCRVVILYFDVIYASISSICFTKFFPSMVTKKEKEGEKRKKLIFSFFLFCHSFKNSYLLVS